jgi:oligopeptide transport system ATP-binding protein
MSDYLLEVKHIKKYFKVKSGMYSRNKGCVQAIDDVSFSIHAGETLGLVGESGCGKSTMARVILRLVEKDSGEIFFQDKNIHELTSSGMRQLRKEMQMVFQSPYESLNPRMTIGDIIAAPFDIHMKLKRSERRKRVEELLEYVGLPKKCYSRYPHEFSGGQRQRVGIARALALKPKLVICDEPVSALDVSIQSQILNLLKQLQKELGLTYIFISHDLSVVKYMSTRIAVMYLGQIMEMASQNEIYENTKHPYTKALLSAIPSPDTKTGRKRIILEGDIPSPIDPPKGCRFSTRCKDVIPICKEVCPSLSTVGGQHLVACHVYAK